MHIACWVSAMLNDYKWAFVPKSIPERQHQSSPLLYVALGKSFCYAIAMECTVQAKQHFSMVYIRPRLSQDPLHPPVSLV